jgi:hypothetical protein
MYLDREFRGGQLKRYVRRGTLLRGKGLTGASYDDNVAVALGAHEWKNGLDYVDWSEEVCLELVSD